MTVYERTKTETSSKRNEHCMEEKWLKRFRSVPNSVRKNIDWDDLEANLPV